MTCSVRVLKSYGSASRIEVKGRVAWRTKSAERRPWSQKSSGQEVRLSTAKRSLLQDDESRGINVEVVGPPRMVSSCNLTCKKGPYKGYGSASRVQTLDLQRWPVNRGSRGVFGASVVLLSLFCINKVRYRVL